MSARTTMATAVLAIACVASLAAFRPAATPAEEFAAIVKTYTSLPQPADWRGIEQLPGIRWAPLPPTALTNCAPDGGCFTRQGLARVGGRPMQVVATGARTMVFHIYLRNGGAPIGEQAVLAALAQSAVTSTLARCPVPGSRGSTNWYRLGGGSAPAHLSVQGAHARGTGEGFVLSAGAELPKLQPNQLALYSDQCEPGADRRPVATSLPHESLAASIVAMLLPTGGSPMYDWAALAALPTAITWEPGGPRRGDLSYRNDPNPMHRSGTVAFGGREFSVLASGTATQVKTIHIDEAGLHPRGEHLLGVVYQKGIAVQLVRCGPLYTQSTNNWYSLRSAGTRPATIRQSIRYDGAQVQDVYELRLDGTLPARDPRDRNPGVNGCQ